MTQKDVSMSIEQDKTALPEWVLIIFESSAESLRISQERADKAESEARRLREALLVARRFIRNGIELRYIQMPDADTPDTAHDTLPLIDAALSPTTPATTNQESTP
jgi:hypothetical protein